MLALWVGLACATHAEAPAEPAPLAPAGAEVSDVWRIDGREVTQAEWERAAAALLEGQEDWSCAETSRGGITSWTQRDAEGRRYEVSVETDSERPTVHELRRLP